MYYFDYGVFTINVERIVNNRKCTMNRNLPLNRNRMTAARRKDDSENTDDEGSGNETQQLMLGGRSRDGRMNMYGNEGDSDLKRKLEEVLAENKRYKAAEDKRKKRKPKKSEKGLLFKRIEDIPKEKRMDEQKTYRLAKLTRTRVWADMKYYAKCYERDLLELSNPTLGIHTENDRTRFKDHILLYIDKTLTTHRHNVLGYIKRVVCGDNGQNGRKFDHVKEFVVIGRS
jgi:hypothetical protein